MAERRYVRVDQPPSTERGCKVPLQSLDHGYLLRTRCIKNEIRTGERIPRYETAKALPCKRSGSFAEPPEYCAYSQSGEEPYKSTN